MRSVRTAAFVLIVLGCGENGEGGSNANAGNGGAAGGGVAGGSAVAGRNEDGGSGNAQGGSPTGGTSAGGQDDTAMAGSPAGGRDDTSTAGSPAGGQDDTAMAGSPVGGRDDTAMAGSPVGGRDDTSAAGSPAGGDDAVGGSDAGAGGGSAVLPRAPSCEAASDGSAVVAEPVELAALGGSGAEAWLASPAIADLDGDGEMEIVSARSGVVLAWHADGAEVFRESVQGRCWSSPLVVDLVPGGGLEVIVACRDTVHAWDAAGDELPGFPFVWEDEMRSLAAGDIDGDGYIEIVAGTTSDVESGGQTDILIALNHDGTVASGFPPNANGSGCDDYCFVHAGFDQNVAIGDVDGDGGLDILLPQDNAYLSLHDGAGRAFDAADVFEDRTKIQGVRGLHDYALAQQGWGPDDALQAHFTNTAPAIADIDGDGEGELVLLASVQNIAQTAREQGVALWVLEHDGTRLADWVEPLHFPGYLSGLWDHPNNIVAITNQVSVADLDAERAGPELVFAGFDGQIHAVDARANLLWSHTYTTADDVGTGGVLVADLSGDGVPEVVFATYSTRRGAGELVILDANGDELHVLALPGRGAMPVPTIGDADGDGDLEIAVSLKDDDPQVLLFEVPGSSDNCLLWPTGRGNDARSGYVP